METITNSTYIRKSPIINLWNVGEHLLLWRKTSMDTIIPELWYNCPYIFIAETHFPAESFITIIHYFTPLSDTNISWIVMPIIHNSMSQDCKAAYIDVYISVFFFWQPFHLVAGWVLSREGCVESELRCYFQTRYMWLIFGKKDNKAN